jgi:hypothetical protein
MTILLPQLEPLPRRTVHRAMVRDKGGQPSPYPGERARGGEIVLRRPWQRIVFILGLALPVLLLLALLMLR